MLTMCSREIFTKKCRQQQIFDSDLKGAWHYNHVTFTPIAKNFMLYCKLIYMLSILCVRLAIKVKVGIPESFKVGWYPPKKTGSSHLNFRFLSVSSRKWYPVRLYCAFYHQVLLFLLKEKSNVLSLVSTFTTYCDSTAKISWLVPTSSSFQGKMMSLLEEIFRIFKVEWLGNLLL